MTLLTPISAWHEKKRVVIKKGTKVEVYSKDYDPVYLCRHKDITFSASKEHLK